MPDEVRGLLYGVARDEDGNALPRAQIWLYEPGTTTEVELYSNRDGSISLGAGPQLADRRGVYSFGVPPGVYDLRIIGAGAFDKTFPGTYVDQVDWSWNRRGQIMLERYDDTMNVDTSPALFDEVGAWQMSEWWNGDEANNDLVWTGQPVDQGGGGLTARSKIRYLGAEDRIFKAGLLWSGWAVNALDLDETAIFQIRLEAAVLTEIPIKFSSNIEPAHGDLSPFYAFGEVTAVASQNDDFELYVYGTDATTICYLRYVKFWVGW